MANDLQLNSIQLGNNADPSKNYVLKVPLVADGTLRIERGDGTGLGNYVNDAAAAAGGVPLNGLYRNGSLLMTRVA